VYVPRHFRPDREEELFALSALERDAVAAIERRSDELLALLADLIRFDTTARAMMADPARDEAALQRYLAGRLGAAGLETDVWEPTPPEVAGNPMMAPDVQFEGRPQLAATLRGGGGGRSLLFNGHVDVVSAEPRAEWTSDPNEATPRDGRIYGRGACDMKGGVAAMVFAAEVLSELGAPLAGDLIVCTTTDEEFNGGGGVGAVAHGVRADAGVVTEPTGGDVWIACRGSLIPTITVTGRAGHAGVGQRHWREGGAVNAVEKAALVLEALARFREDWVARPHQRHPHMSPGDFVPVIMTGGHWIVSYPASCTIVYHVAFLPAEGGENGMGEELAREIEGWVTRAAAADPWLAEHPPTVEWAPPVPAAEVPADHAVVTTMLGAAAALGAPATVGAPDFWHDGATFTRFGATPCVCFGPGDVRLAHMVDESVPVDELVRCAQALAVGALRYCGASS
jgi:acetylornithine deacetylase